MLVSQLVNRFYKPIRTETALFYEDTESLVFKGVYIRNEHQVISEAFASVANSGVIAYTNKCGAKLSIDTVIAVVYPNEEEIYTRRKIAELKEQIETLSEADAFAISDGNTQDNAQIEAFMGQLSDTHLRILQSISVGNYGEVSSFNNEYLSLQSKIHVIRGEATGFSRRITELQSEVNSLERELSVSRQELTVPEPGYFVSNADGYEAVLRFDEALSITREKFENVIANPMLQVNDNVAGKVIDDYKWRMAALIPTARTRTVSEGSTVSLRVGAYPRTVTALVVSAVDQEDGDTLFVFECELLNEEFVKKRVAGVRLLLDDYSGIRLPQSAVTFNEADERGVYVKNGSAIVFRRINMLRSEEGFVIVEISQEQGFLRLFDEVVVSGRNLYDGKIIG
jgi:putative membrane fusion protein